MIKVTDGAAQKDEQGRQVFIDGAEAFFVARMQTMKLNFREGGADGSARRAQAGGAHVDRREDTRAALAELFGQQMDGFLAVAGAQFDDAAHGRAGDDVARVRFENGVFRARQIILGQTADLLEKLGAALIVKVIGFQPARLIPQGRQDRLGGDCVQVGALNRPDLRLERAPMSALFGGKDGWCFFLCHCLRNYKRKSYRNRPVSLFGDDRTLALYPVRLASKNGIKMNPAKAGGNAGF